AGCASQTIRNPLQLYRHLLRLVRTLPPGARPYYSNYIRQAYNSHSDETDPDRVLRRPEAGREMTAAESAGCACKGIRACKICCAAKQLPLVAVSAASSLPQPDQPPLHFCIDCQAVRATPRHADGDDAEHWSAIPSSASGLAGIRVFRDFINPDEEAVLAAEIDKRPWAPSQSGRRKQDYGPKVNFKRRRLNTASFKGLPPYWSALLPRLLALPGLADFQPVELCNLDYQPELGAHIDPHIDDTWLWGDRLVTLNLCSDTSLTLSQSAGSTRISIPMPRRSVLVLSGPARYDWLHAVLPDDVTGRRLAVTLRELAPDWLETVDGRVLLKAGAAFDGVSVVELKSGGS
uniref:LYR motif-containing protein 9 n=2 Tax=Macrostomum lignano TaxID=282301 RepID=A0A1I8I4R1_9PLAT